MRVDSLAVEERVARDVAKRVHEPTGQISRYAIAHGIASQDPTGDFKPGDILAQAKTENFARVEARDLPELLAKWTAVTTMQLRALR